MSDGHAGRELGRAAAAATAIQGGSSLRSRSGVSPPARSRRLRGGVARGFDAAAAAAAAAARWAARGGGVPSFAFCTTRRAPSERALPTVACSSSFSAALKPRRDRQLVQAGQQAAEAELLAHRERRHADDLAVLRLRHAHEEVRVGQRLPVRLRERDRVRVVARPPRGAPARRRRPAATPASHERSSALLSQWCPRHAPVSARPRAAPSADRVRSLMVEHFPNWTGLWLM